MNKKTLSILLCLMVYTIFGFSFLFSKKALAYAAPLLMVAIRFLVAFAVLNLMLLTKKVSISLKGKPVGKLLLLGLIQPVLYFVCESYGIEQTSASFAGVMLGLLPVMGLICGRIFLKEKITLFQGICVVLSVGGVALTSLGGPIRASFSGILFLFGAVVSAAMFSVISRNISDIFSPFERTYVMFLLGSIIFTVSAVIQQGKGLGNALMDLGHLEFWIGILYLAVISSVVAFMMLNYALNYIEAGVQTIFSNFCTVVSIPAGILIMHDQFSLWQLLGMVIIIISVFGISMAPPAGIRRNKEKAA